MIFTFASSLIYGVGSSRLLPDRLRNQAWSRVGVLVDSRIIDSAAAWPLLETDLVDQFDLDVWPIDAAMEPTYDYLDEVASWVRRGPAPDVLIGIGGGTALDLVKGAAVLATNPGPGLNFRGFDQVNVPGIPTVCIPTTAGTGSEVTPNAVFTDTIENRKLGINGRFMSASMALLDAEWIAQAPRDVAVSSGLDALVHSLESFMTWKSTDVSRVFSCDALSLVAENLVQAVDGEIEAQQRMLLGSYLAAVALFNSGSGISGALSYPIGVVFKVPHGIAGGITLPSVVRFNVDAGWHGFRPLLSRIRDCTNLTDEACSEEFVLWLESLYRILGVPDDFGRWGLCMENFFTLTPQIEALQAAFDQNPVEFSAVRDAPRLLTRHLAHRA